MKDYGHNLSYKHLNSRLERHHGCYIILCDRTRQGNACKRILKQAGLFLPNNLGVNALLKLCYALHHYLKGGR